MFCAENTRTVKLPKFVAVFPNLSSVLCVVSDERDHDQGFSHNSQIILRKNRMHWCVLPGKNYLIWPKLQTPLFNSSWQTQFWMAINFFLQNLCVSSIFYVECQEMIKKLITVQYRPPKSNIQGFSTGEHSLYRLIILACFNFLTIWCSW